MIIQFLIFRYLVVQLRSIEKICSLQIFYTGCFRRSHAELFLWVGVLKIYSKYYPVNLLHIFRTPFLKNTFGRMLLMLHNNFTVTAVGIFQTALGRYLTKFILTIFLFHMPSLKTLWNFDDTLLNICYKTQILLTIGGFKMKTTYMECGHINHYTIRS